MIKNIADGPTTLFAVYNKAGKRMFVLAMDARSARSIASAFHHVRDKRNATVRLVDMPDLQQTRPKFASAVRRALKSRIQGPVLEKDGFAFVDGIQGKVFAPLSAADE